MRKNLPATGAATLPRHPDSTRDAGVPGHPYTGMWVTEDGYIRHQLLPNNRYIEARGTRERAYEGRYAVMERRILYWDDTGFTADGDFVEENVLHHAGMVLYRQQP